jgi:glycosyltransferase involved in cell wall biosynthesis
MENNGYEIIIASFAPQPVGYDGKTGALVRLVEVFRRLERLNDIKITVVSSNRVFFDYLKGNDLKFNHIAVKSNLEFRGLVSLCVKSLLIIAKSFFNLNFHFVDNRGRKMIAYASSDLFWEVIPACIFKKKNKNIRWIQVIHHIYPGWKKRQGSKIVSFFGYYLQRFSFRLIKKRADKIIVLSDVARKDLARMNFPESKIYISSNGVDIDHFENVEKASEAYEGVFLGRLSLSKGVSDIIEIWKGVAREIPAAKLAIIGGGGKKTKEALQTMINECNLQNNIELLGFLENEKAHPILKSAKVFLFPSHEEGWGIAIAEAMACGLPVVSWDLPVFGEIFEDCIIQIKENDFSQFSNEIIELLNDEKMRTGIGLIGKEFIKKYSWDNVAKREGEILFSSLEK